MEQTLPALVDWADFEWTFLDFEDEDLDEDPDDETGDGPGFWLEDISPFPDF